MSAGTPQTRKVFYLRETVKESLTRKTAKYRGRIKYLDVCMTQTPYCDLFPHDQRATIGVPIGLSAY